MHEQLIDVVASDQHHFQASLYRSEADGAPVLLFLPALGTPARVYARFGHELAEQGVSLCVPDWRGLGSSSIRAQRHTDFGYRHLLEMDHRALLARVRSELPDAPIWLGGHSLGGQLSALAAGVTAPAVDGIVLLASGSVHLRCYPAKLRFGIRTIVWMARIFGATLGYFPGRRLGFGGAEARSVMRDWGRVAHSGAYRIADATHDYEAGLRQFAGSVLALNFEADHWAPARAAEALLAKLPRARKTHWRWASADSQGIALDHFSWTKRPDLVAPALATHLLTATTHSRSPSA